MGFSHTSTWISHRSTCVPPSWTPSHIPPNPIPMGPRALVLVALSHASNLHWSSILHMVIYLFQCYSLKSSHPHLLPQSPKVSSLHLCLFCCFAYRIIIAIFLNSIYIYGIPYMYTYIYTHTHSICFSFWLTSPCIIGSTFIHLITTDSNTFLFTAD